MIIVIDGPAGSGKSSTAKAVAERLEIEYIDSGALYRAITLLFIEAVTEDQFFERLNETSISFRYSVEQFRVFIDCIDITSKLRSEAVSEKVSCLAEMPRVRAFVNALLKEAVKHGTYIAEGRDLGTAVFPDADLKFFMQADVEERARRRFLELKEVKKDITIERVRKNILDRDRKDSKRRKDPLKKAPDAIEINTSGLKFDEQVQQICSIINNKTDIITKQ